MRQKFTSFCQVLKETHTKENWFLFFCLTVYGPITIAIRARFEYDSSTIRLQHAKTRYEVFVRSHTR